MRLGKLDLKIVSDGEFRLDGGAMFGVVPKVLWERRKPADELNRVRMTVNCLLIETAGERVLIDTGLGDKHDSRFREMFGMPDEAVRLPEALAEAGHTPEEVDHVILTHLHFDHCGWNTREVDGVLVPTFPNARYWMNRGEVEHARKPNPRDRASYLPDNWEPLFEAGVVELFDDSAEPAPGVRVTRAPGHNRDMCIVLLDGGEEKGVFLADLVPTAAHLPYAWVMGYDLYPTETIENKQLWLPRACAGGWLCIFEHDPELPVGRLREEKPGSFVAEPATATTAT